MKGRILFVSYTAAWTGPTRSLRLLLEHLRRTWTVSVLLPGDGPFAEWLRGEGVPVHSLPSLTKRHLGSVYARIRREGTDLVYANNTHSSSRVALVAARAAGAAYVCHVRGMGWDKTWRKMWQLRFADAVVAVSEATAASIRRFVRPGSVRVIPNGVPVGEEPVDSAARARLRSELGVAEGDIVFLSAAHVRPRKGQLHAVEAFEAARRAVPGRLVLAGRLERDPEYVERVRSEIRRRGLEGRAVLLGYRTDLEELLSAADVFVHTAVADPHPRAVLEAMAARLPVAAFAVDGVAETVRDGETGFLVPAGDAEGLAARLVELGRDGELRRAMGERGRQRVEREYSAAATGAAVAELIERVMSEGRIDGR